MARKLTSAQIEFQRKLRKEKGTRKDTEFAKTIGFSQQTVSAWISGIRSPDITNLKKIADALGCTTDYLLDHNKVRTPDVTIIAISEYTGLSESAIMALHEMNVGKEAEEKRPLSFINRCFADSHISVLAQLERYITSSMVRRRLDVKEVVPSDYESTEEFERALKKEEIAKRTIWIDSSDDMSEGLLVGPLYREAKMTEIRKALDSLREEEEKK